MSKNTTFLCAVLLVLCIHEATCIRPKVRPEQFVNVKDGSHVANFFSALWPSSEYMKSIKTSPVGGGGDCAACTVAVTLFEQLTEIHNNTADEMLEEICSYFPLTFQNICDYFVQTYGDVLVHLVANKYNPDEVCHALEFCTLPQCALFPQKTGRVVKPTGFDLKNKRNTGENTLKAAPWQWIIDLFNRMAQNHEPSVDVDDDFFSTIETFRGTLWRGRDCNDFSSEIYPGRQSNSGDSQDDNCNGISGINPKTGNTYEQDFCANSGAMGTIVLGDSGGAHFEIPEPYLNASQIKKNTYKDLLFYLASEFDLPELSGYTGYLNSTPNVPFPVQSIYMNMRQRNRCNHRDYQNLGVNGCRSGNMLDNTMHALARNQSVDKPALVFLELIGNDVCSPKQSLDHMTTVSEFHDNIVGILEFLDTKLPAGSHVVFVGLAKGALLFDLLQDKYHPIGVKYPQFYDFLNCIEINPCWVWMNSNETIRMAGQQRADDLSAVYNQIIANYTFTHFDMVYYDFPMWEVMYEWVNMGYDAYTIIEPIDGFHPNGAYHTLMAQVFWEKLMNDHPEFLGKENPYNDLIDSIFGDQGGY